MELEYNGKNNILVYYPSTFWINSDHWCQVCKCNGDWALIGTPHTFS